MAYPGFLLRPALIFPWAHCWLLTGSFLIGLFWGISEKAVFHPNLRIFLFTGLLGGFTTFSAYNLETFSLLRDGRTMFAMANFLLNNILGIALVVVGFLASRHLVNIS